jgi:hypothetical protein
MHSTNGPFLKLCEPWQDYAEEFGLFLDQHLDKAPTFHDNRSIFSALENGEVSLWRVFDSESVTKAFLLTRVHENSTWRIGSIDLAVGHDLTSWIDVTQFFKEHFKALGCNLMEIEGRKGWAKLLSEYGLKEHRTTLTVGL